MASVPAKRFAREVLPASVSPLRFAVTAAETAEYAAAIADLIEGAVKVLAKDTGATFAADAAESISSRYLRENSLSKLTGGFSEESVNRLQSAIADAWDKGGSFDQIVAAVQDTFEDFSTVRAGMIAQTEGNSAYNFARSQMARDAGATEKSWETESGNPCEDCLENEAEGWIGVSEDFPAGNDIPLHPNCSCTLNFRSGFEGEEE